jgi:hypothetical protein
VGKKRPLLVGQFAGRAWRKFMDQTLGPRLLNRIPSPAAFGALPLIFGACSRETHRKLAAIASNRAPVP